MSDRFLPPSASRGGVPQQHRDTGGAGLERGGGPQGMQGWSEVEEDPLHWQRRLAAVLRHKWILVLGVCVGIAGGVYVQRGLAPTYQTESTLWIERGGAAAGDGAGPIRPTPLLSAYGWRDLIQSNAVMQPVVDSLGLFVSPADTADAHLFEDFDVVDDARSGSYELRVSASGDEVILLGSEGEEIERAAAGSALGESRGLQWVPPAEALAPGRRVRFRVTRPGEAARRLAERLDVQIDPEGTFLSVMLQGDDPEHIARVVNGVTERYVQVAGDLKREKLDIMTASLEEQLEYAAENLRQAELALENFRVNAITQPSENGTPTAGNPQAQNPVFDRYQNLQVEGEEIDRDRLAIERALTRSREQGRLATETLELIPSVRESSDLSGALALASEKRAELRAQRLHYTDQHESVQTLLADLQQLEQETIPELLGHVLDELTARRAEIDGLVGEAATELQQIPARSVEQTRLERRFRSAEDLVVDLQGRFESARLGAASTVPDVSVLDPAPVPESPTSAPGARVLLLGALAGLGLGLAGALLRDYRDQRLRSPEQVTRDLGLPILSAIPHARPEGHRLHDEDQQQVVEAFRNLRLTTTFAHGGGPLALTVTSPAPGDGKSFTTSNLALAFAEAGRRTLVIDGDVRRGVLHELFAVERRPGLTDHLAGEASLDEILKPSELGDLTVIPSGSLFRDAPELLSLPRMNELLEELRARFDVVLIDSAPMGNAVDPYLLATLSGSLMVVLRDRSTDRVLAEARLSELHRLPVHLLGAVLNDVPTGPGPYNYYAYPSGYEPHVAEGASPRGHRRLGGGPERPEPPVAAPAGGGR